MAQSPEDPKLRFYKFWQEVQISQGLAPTEAVALAMTRAKGSAEQTPEYFRGDVEAKAIDALDPRSVPDLEKAVLAFRDPFLLNKAFLADSTSAKKRASDAMDVDTNPCADACIPGIDLPGWRAWIETAQQFVEAPLKDGEGDSSMHDQDRPSYQERMLESFGDLSSALERVILSKSRKVEESNGVSGPQSEDRYGYPDIPPSFLDSPHGLRFLIMILFHPSLADPDCYNSWHRILRAFRILTAKQRDILAGWLADDDNVGIDDFQDILQNLQQLITITFLSEFASSDMPATAQHDPESIPEQVWDFFVMRTSQKCKNALCCIDVFWKANLKRRVRAKRWRKAALDKGAAAMLTEGSGGAGPSKDLQDYEFFNDALNSVERVLQHEFTHAMYFEHIERENKQAGVQRSGRRPQKPRSVLEIEEKSMLNNYTFGLLAHNFCLDAGNKCRFLMFDTASRQREDRDREIMHQVLQGNRRVNPYLVLKVKRSNLVQDTLQKFTSLQPAEFRKTLKVVFEGEPGVDEGGVRKEFFQLLVEQLYDPNYAMFTYNSSNKTYWFNPGSFESNLQYEMFGALLGVAIYNRVILDIRFTAIVYEKLLADDPAGTIACSIDTMVDIQPDLAKSLLGMLKFEGNVEEVYCRNFVASYENFGAVVEVPLKEGGELIPVTNENCAEFVELYVDWFFNKSVSEKFSSFKRGFLRCMEVAEEKPRLPARGRDGMAGTDLLSMLLAGDTSGSSHDAAASDEASGGGASSAQAVSSGSAESQAVAAASTVQGETKANRGFNMFLKLFRPAELELLVCGSQSLDFTEYKKNTEYADGFEASSQLCVWFWEIAIGSFSNEQRRSLLAFISGSDRAPPKGLGAPEARLTISRQSPDCEQLPTSHTCFNHLLLPEYDSKEKLEAKLRLAIQFNTGFGMV